MYLHFRPTCLDQYPTYLAAGACDEAVGSFKPKTDVEGIHFVSSKSEPLLHRSAHVVA